MQNAKLNTAMRAARRHYVALFEVQPLFRDWGDSEIQERITRCRVEIRHFAAEGPDEQAAVAHLTLLHDIIDQWRSIVTHGFLVSKGDRKVARSRPTTEQWRVIFRLMHEARIDMLGGAAVGIARRIAEWLEQKEERLA